MLETILSVRRIGELETVEKYGPSLRCTVPMFRKLHLFSVEKLVGWVVAAPGVAD